MEINKAIENCKQTIAKNVSATVFSEIEKGNCPVCFREVPRSKVRKFLIILLVVMLAAVTIAFLPLFAVVMIQDVNSISLTLGDLGLTLKDAKNISLMMDVVFFIGMVVLFCAILKSMVFKKLKKLFDGAYRKLLDTLE